MRRAHQVPALPGGKLALLEQHRAFELAVGISGDGVVARADLRTRRQPGNVFDSFRTVRLQLVPGFQQFVTVIRRSTIFLSCVEHGNGRVKHLMI
ncbi:hypothetical protein DCC62_22975 [candidate division KSB1 bacterium]|nr:MAG: hypothetical protein DCC62_22975 [candidate division KSB1 bacterium]